MIDKSVRKCRKLVYKEYKESENNSVLFEYMYFLHMLYNLTKVSAYKEELLYLIENFNYDTMLIHYEQVNLREKTQYLDMILGTMCLKKSYGLLSLNEQSKIQYLFETGMFDSAFKNLRSIDFMYASYMEQLEVVRNIKGKEKYNYSQYFGKMEDDLYVATHKILVKNQFFANLNKENNKIEIDFLSRNLDYVLQHEYVDLLGEYLMSSVAIEQQNVKIDYGKIWSVIARYMTKDMIINYPYYDFAQNLHATHTVILGAVVSDIRRNLIVL